MRSAGTEFEKNRESYSEQKTQSVSNKPVESKVRNEIN